MAGAGGPLKRKGTGGQQKRVALWMGGRWRGHERWALLVEEWRRTSTPVRESRDLPADELVGRPDEIVR